MSAFLGPIHNWLYNKIKIQNEFTKELLNNFNIDISLEYEDLLDGELSEIIDETNIHGWLQTQVSLVENRLSFAVKKILETDENSLENILSIANKYGEGLVLENAENPHSLFNSIDNLLLSGMPCDRVNSIISNDEEKLSYVITTDIHGKYWENKGLEVDIFYKIRESIIKGMLKNTEYEFLKDEDTFIILKKK